MKIDKVQDALEDLKNLTKLVDEIYERLGVIEDIASDTRKKLYGEEARKKLEFKNE